MPNKKSRSASNKPKFKIFVHASGGCIAAQEISRKDGISIEVKYPSFVRQNANGIGFSFEPFQYVVDGFILYTGSLLGESSMPSIVEPFYLKYIKDRKEENK